MIFCFHSATIRKNGKQLILADKKLQILYFIHKSLKSLKHIVVKTSSESALKEFSKGLPVVLNLFFFHFCLQQEKQWK